MDCQKTVRNFQLIVQILCESGEGLLPLTSCSPGASDSGLSLGKDTGKKGGSLLRTGQFHLVVCGYVC